MKRFKSTRLRVFFGILLLGLFFYLADCISPFKAQHPDLPWLESGVYAGGPAGFFLTIIFVVGAFGYLIFGKDK
jgi:hypothetical protein